MKYDPTGKDVVGSTVPCPCKHPSHGPEGCKNLMEADSEEDRCAACEDHVPYVDTA
jgi:hypothetical protein